MFIFYRLIQFFIESTFDYFFVKSKFTKIKINAKLFFQFDTILYCSKKCSQYENYIINFCECNTRYLFLHFIFENVIISYLFQRKANISI
jgi:hypothetical protein